MAVNPSTAQPAQPEREHLRSLLRNFWQRVTDGLELQQLWSQFASEARASYGLYSHEVDWEAIGKATPWKRPFHIARALFVAMLMKLSPARRVLLLAAAIVFFLAGINFNFGNNGQVNASHLALLAALILFVLLALELADRVTMKRDLEIAREIQSWLVPAAPPAISGVDIAFTTRPANTVAGDYYDAFLRPGHEGAEARLLVVVADVAGKSVPAALLMATFQASLRALAALPSTLGELVTALNAYASAHSLGGLRFTTAFLAEYDPASRALQYINCGHNYPILRRASGASERLETGGVPLGIEPDARYDSGATVLASGDLLLIPTDGVEEAQSAAGQEFGAARLADWARTAPTTSAKAVLDSLMAEVDRFVLSARQHDDITCLVMRIE